MSSEKPGFDCHLFICTNQPDNPSKCGSKGSENMRRELKERCAKAFGKKVRVNASGCLGYCEQGIAAVIYPQSEWYLQLKATPETADLLFKAVQEKINP